jgi:FxsC-like protein
MCSPNYFQKPYCGKEWQVFRDRRDLYLNTNPHGPRPRTILPVMWWPVSEQMFGALPEHVRDVQLAADDRGTNHQADGLRELVKRRQVGATKFITHLAETIIANSTPEMPQVTRRSIKEYPSAFEHPSAALASSSASRLGAEPLERPTDAVCVVVAAGRHELANGMANADAYGQAGGADWHPFPPDQRDAGALVRAAADTEQLQVEIVPPEASLLQKVELAWNSNIAAVLLVDRWTLRIERYFQQIAEFDRQYFPNAVILVPWNAADNPTSMDRALLDTLVDHAFPRHSLYPDPDTFIDSVSTPEELHAAMQQGLRKARSLLVARGRPRRHVPRGNMPPSISGAAT